MIRGRLIAILEERTKMLDAKERDADREKKLASQGASEAAKEAQRLAAQAAARAKLAVKAGREAEVLRIFREYCRIFREYLPRDDSLQSVGLCHVHP